MVRIENDLTAVQSRVPAPHFHHINGSNFYLHRMGPRMTRYYSEQDSPTSVEIATREFIWWSSFWGWLGAVFVLSVTITNLLHGLFHLDLLPVFENVLGAFRVWLHWATDIFLFSWIRPAIEYGWDSVCAVVLPVTAI